MPLKSVVIPAYGQITLVRKTILINLTLTSINISSKIHTLFFSWQLSIAHQNYALTANAEIYLVDTNVIVTKDGLCLTAKFMRDQIQSHAFFKGPKF